MKAFVSCILLRLVFGKRILHVKLMEHGAWLPLLRGQTVNFSIAGFFVCGWPVQVYVSVLGPQRLRSFFTAASQQSDQRVVVLIVRHLHKSVEDEL